jgi:hypothetical protein
MVQGRSSDCFAELADQADVILILALEATACMTR